MIWSMPAAQLRQHHEAIRSARPPMPQLQTTERMQKSFEERNIPFEPVDYFELPAISHRIGKMVIPFVALDGRGKLIDSLPSFYGVSTRPDTQQFDKKRLTMRIQQSHVTAEDLSLRNGIFTPYARTTAEIFVTETLAEVVQEGYIHDRIAHLNGLAKEVMDTEQLYPKQKTFVSEELDLAIDALTSRVS